MKKLLINLFLAVIATFSVSAREIYCTIIKNNNGQYEIIPNKEYLNDNYWNYISKDRKGNVKKFNTLQDAITQLSRFGWKVVKGQNTNGSVDNSVLMEHNVESIYDLKSSREELFDFP